MRRELKGLVQAAELASLKDILPAIALQNPETRPGAVSGRCGLVSGSVSRGHRFRGPLKGYQRQANIANFQDQIVGSSRRKPKRLSANQMF